MSSAPVFRPRLTLQTLTRGDGLLGVRAVPGFGPRSTQATVARVDWTYATERGAVWTTPAPADGDTLQGELWPAPTQRQPTAEAAAREQLMATLLRPLPARALQWRTPDAARGHDGLWTLAEEGGFGDYWSEQVPRLQALGWQIVVQPGFAHFTVPVQRWSLVIDAADGVAGAPAGRALVDPLDRHATAGRGVSALGGDPRSASWRVSLGIEVEGESLDLAPLLADLFKRDGRWLKAADIAVIDDDAVVVLRAPGGRRIDARAGPLKAVAAAMVDLLTDPQRAGGPLLLTGWQAQQAEALRQSLADTQAARAGAHGAWQLQGEAGLSALAGRLRAAGSPAAVAMPVGLGIVLRPYQQHGVAWLQYLREHRLGGILADDMGLGKTVQVLAHVLIEKQQGRLDVPALAVLPTSLIANWQAEAARHAPGLRVLALHGPRRADERGRLVDHDLVLTTYPLVWRDVAVLQAQPWHLLVLDEAQVAKNAGSRVARALRQLDARHRLCVTGTPLENHLGELWAHFDLLMPGFLGDTRSFARIWRKPIETDGETLRAQLLAQRVRPFILRRRKADVATELLPLTEVVRRVALEGQQRALYESVRVAADEQVRRVLSSRGFAQSQIAVLDALLKLRQVCCDPRLVKGAKTPASMERAKMAMLLPMLQELVAEGRRVIVFSQFTEMLALVEADLAALPTPLPLLVLTGDTPPRERGAVVQRFQAGEVPVLLASLKAGGVGLNLTAADTVIHLDPWWNPAVQAQATARAHRIGQDKPVFAYQIVAEGSIEERMLALQQRKSVLAEGVLGSDAATAPKFSADDLDGLLAPLH